MRSAGSPRRAARRAARAPPPRSRRRLGAGGRAPSSARRATSPVLVDEQLARRELVDAREAASAAAARTAASGTRRSPPGRAAPSTRPLARIAPRLAARRARPPGPRRPVERLDAEPVAREQQPLPAVVPERDREHAAAARSQALDARAPRRGARSPRRPSRCGSGGRAPRARARSSLEVVDLAVAGDRAPCRSRCAAAGCRSARSMIDRRRKPSADAPGSTWKPSSSGPRWALRRTCAAGPRRRPRARPPSRRSRTWLHPGRHGESVRKAEVAPGPTGASL